MPGATAAEPAIPRPAHPLHRAIAWIGPDFGLVLGFTAALAVLVAAYGGSYKWKEGPIVISAGIAAVLVLARLGWRGPAIVLNRPGARAEFGRAVTAILRDWGPVILIMWLFQSLETYTGVVRQTSIDAYLYQADCWLFGVEPTVWLSKHSTPLLTDYMAFAYGCYFITPMILATMLSLRGRREDFREMTTALVLQMGIGFLLFLVFPAGPPRYYDPLLHGGFDPPVLHSHFGLFELQQGAFDSADPARTRSAFPSLHCSLALLTLIYSYRFSDAVWPRHPRLWFRIVLVLVVSLWISVVYLRHHWVVDIFAGLIVGTLANWLAPILRLRWPKLSH
ncbi:MAG TPA: phosphatase PAP2 family protein [Kofleriaceae bacterium]|nr:phosphatase PAP2 family protein [Kofleriaceae bacterium]